MQKFLDSRARIWKGIGIACLFSGLALVAMLPLHDSGEPFCPMRRWLGIPCLLCGGTRATQALFHGQWSRALYLNEWAVLAIILACLWSLVALIEIISRRRLLPPLRWNAWRFAGLFVLLMICWGLHVRSALITPKPELLYDCSVAKELRAWLNGT